MTHLCGNAREIALERAVHRLPRSQFIQHVTRRCFPAKVVEHQWCLAPSHERTHPFWPADQPFLWRVPETKHTALVKIRLNANLNNDLPSPLNEHTSVSELLGRPELLPFHAITSAPQLTSHRLWVRRNSELQFAHLICNSASQLDDFTKKYLDEDTSFRQIGGSFPTALWASTFVVDSPAIIVSGQVNVCVSNLKREMSRASRRVGFR